MENSPPVWGMLYYIILVLGSEVVEKFDGMC